MEFEYLFPRSNCFSRLPLADAVNPGAQNLTINIHNKGYVEFNVASSKRRRRSLLNAVVLILNFFIKIVRVDSVTPSSGGTAGGTHVTIAGRYI